MYCPIVKMAHLMQLVHSAIANRENGGKKNCLQQLQCGCCRNAGFHYRGARADRWDFLERYCHKNV